VYESPVGCAVAQEHDHEIRSSRILLAPDLPDEGLGVADSRLCLHAESLSRDPQEQIPASCIARIWEWSLSRHVDTGRELRPETSNERLVALVQLRLACRVKLGVQLESERGCGD